ncbi:hypothetical protein Stsp02_23040 [Streptomyces sp. NBRC 14336]|nr:hypothetical protein Stsp02_23040 [Streptomyces sp. NBRC 14336]
MPPVLAGTQVAGEECRFLLHDHIASNLRPGVSGVPADDRKQNRSPHCKLPSMEAI